MKLFTDQKKEKKGFILLLSVLVASIVLAISLGIYTLSIKEVILASFLRDSALAFGAADRAIECTLYWDRSAPQNGMPYTIFSTSSAYVIPASIDLAMCDNQQLNEVAVTQWLVTNPPATPPVTGITTFTLTYPDRTCAEVIVSKEGDTGTTIVSNGYNTCDTNSPRRIQRSIQVKGNF